MGEYEKTPAELERIATQVIDAAFKVHKTLGPGLLESVYEACLVHELRLRGLSVDVQIPLPIRYEGMVLDAALRLDMLVEDQLVVELKAVETMHPVFEAQILSYLKLTGKRLGLLINFNVPTIKQGIRRVIL
jgi:GxxExxY protein